MCNKTSHAHAQRTWGEGKGTRWWNYQNNTKQQMKSFQAGPLSSRVTKGYLFYQEYHCSYYRIQCVLTATPCYAKIELKISFEIVSISTWSSKIPAVSLS